MAFKRKMVKEASKIFKESVNILNKNEEKYGKKVDSYNESLDEYDNLLSKVSRKLSKFKNTPNDFPHNIDYKSKIKYITNKEKLNKKEKLVDVSNGVLDTVSGAGIVYLVYSDVKAFFVKDDDIIAKNVGCLISIIGSNFLGWGCNESLIEDYKYNTKIIETTNKDLLNKIIVIDEYFQAAKKEYNSLKNHFNIVKNYNDDFSRLSFDEQAEVVNLYEEFDVLRKRVGGELYA